ncbi:VWA domain-containing protein [Rossellomorea sp. SC111]|uniref:VWA domain-containing protein n=1 Tax=Rossellomorea sp. SC111 TaxID=2968985 RepID=UPI00215AFB7C|nr:VWA domain-containing protein [Rossellomorea sp. SC111]MCR8850845.1 VWA domain-containing protein [Rossellomorea sp. SC111]
MRKHLFILLALAVVLSGCNSEKQNEKPSSQSKVEQKDNKEKKTSDKENNEEEAESFYSSIPKVPNSAEEVISQLPGKFFGEPIRSEEFEPTLFKEVKNAPSLSEDPSEEEYDQYFKYLYSLAAVDFPDPQDLVKKWEYSMSGTPNTTDERYQFKDNYNIEIILDSSGSMKNDVEGKTQMDLAKQAINDFLSTAPEEANVSLRVYGHKGSGSDQDKKMSCSSVEQVYGFDKYNKEQFDKALNSFEPSGWTPIEGALKASKEAFSKYDSKDNTNLIYLVSDGIETCDGNPVEYAKTFADSNIKPIVNVIGFNVDSAAQKQLKSLADNTNGVYTTVTNAKQLEEEFDRAKDVLESWEDWKDDALNDADAKKVDANFDILSYTNDYSLMADIQNNNLYGIIADLSLEDVITIEQKKELMERKNKAKDIVDESEKKIKEDLEMSRDKNIDDLRKEINEKYNTNTN